jgi:hypothetical protein
MRNLKTFNQYNEGVKDFITRVGRSVNKGIGRLFRRSDKEDGTKPKDSLANYDIKTEKIDNYTYKFYHNNRLVARIFQPDGEEGSEMGSPVFKIYIYLYDTEVKNTKGVAMKVLDPDAKIKLELAKQSERPYFKLGKKGFKVQKLVQTFYEWWAEKTKSGRATTNRLNRPKQTDALLRDF